MALLILVVLFFLLFPHGAAAQESEDVPSTAWKDGHFHVDVAGVVRRSAYDADDHLHPNIPTMQAGKRSPTRLDSASFQRQSKVAQCDDHNGKA